MKAKLARVSWPRGGTAANLWLHRIVLSYRKFGEYASACTSALFLAFYLASAWPGIMQIATR